MQTSVTVSLMGAVSLFLLTLPAHAFMESEEQQFQAEIHEAKVRANDFESTLKKMERLDQEREAASQGIGKERERVATELERIRTQFVKERDARADEELERERLEQEDLRLKEKEARKMEEVRKDYVVKRDRVRRVLSREAYIDEAREYGL